MNEDILMRRIMALDFMAFDLALFLNTHPEDKEAIETYEEIAKQAKKAHKEYEEHCGAVYMCDGVRDGKWCWADDPWPWQKEANISIKGA